MKDRIKHFIEYKGITAGELAVMLDVQRSNISHILNGRNKPGAALIEKLLMVFPDLNARWLLTGEGIMSQDSNVEEKVKEPVAKAQLEIDEDFSIKQEKAERNIIEPQLPPTVDSDDVEKMILLYKDGTFATYTRRGKK